MTRRHGDMDVRVLAAEAEDAFRRSTCEGSGGAGDDRHDFHDALRRLEARLARDEGTQHEFAEAMEICIATLRDPRVQGRANRDLCARCEALFYRRSGRGGVHAEANATIERLGKSKTGTEDVRDWTRIAAMADVFGQELGVGTEEIAKMSARQLQKESGIRRRALLRAWTHSIRGKEGNTNGSKDRSSVEEDSFAKASKIMDKLGKESDEKTRAEAARLYLALAESKTLRQWKKQSHVDKFLAQLGIIMGDPNMYIRKIAGKAMGKAYAELDHTERVNLSAAKPKGQSHAEVGTYGLQKAFKDAATANQRNKMLGLTEAWVVFIRESAKVKFHDGMAEGEAIRLSMQVLSMLESFCNPAGKNLDIKSLFPHPQACIQYIVHEAAISRLSEQGQLELLEKLVCLVEQDRKPVAAVCIVVLKLAERLLCILGELPADLQENIYNKVAGLMQHEATTVRCQAAITASHLILISPQSAADRLRNHVSCFLNARDALSKIKDDKANILDALSAFQGQGWAIAALLSANKSLLYGFPMSLIRHAIDVAVQCIVKPSTSSNGIAALISTERDVAFQILAAVASSAPGVLLERQGGKFMKFWNMAFSAEHMKLLKEWKEDAHVLAWELHWRSSALEALTAFAGCFEALGDQAQLETFMETATDVFINALEVGENESVKKCLVGGQVQGRLRASTQLYFFQLFRCFHKLPFSQRVDVHRCVLPFALAPLMQVDDKNQCAYACASLREVLNVEDAILGPWFPGNSALEDGLEAFVGGTDGPLPCIWGRKTLQELSSQISAVFFPLQNSMPNMLVTEQMRCLATVLCQTTNKKAQELCAKLSEAFAQAKLRLKGERQTAGRVSTAANIAYVALLFLKSVPRNYKNNEVAKVLYTLGAEIFLEGKKLHGDTVLLRASAELRALATCSAPHEQASAYIKKMCEGLQGSAFEEMERAATCLALGRAFDRIGGMQLSSSVPSAMAGLLQSAGKPAFDCHVWALHALWLTARGAGLSFLKKVKPTLNLCVDVLQSYQHEHLMLDHLCAMLATTSVAILGPEFKPGTWYFQRCCNLIEQAAASEDVGPSSELERVLFVQQLILFAPEYISPAEDLPVLLASLDSLQPVLRSAVVATLRHMVEANASSILPFEIEGGLFEALDSESDEVILVAIERTLLALLEAGAPCFPSRWLNLCARFILVANKGQDPLPSSAHGVDSVEACSEDPEDSLTGSTEPNNLPVSFDSKKQGGVLTQTSAPRLRTRKFAANCLVKILNCCETNGSLCGQVQSDSCNQGLDSDVFEEGLFIAVLQTAVDIGYKIATGTLVMLQAQGLEFLLKIALAFKDSKDPQIEEQGILVQYQAQFLSAIRSAMLKSFPLPHPLVGGLQLASAFITCDIAGGDPAAIRRAADLMGKALRVVSQNKSTHSAMYSEEVCRGLENAVAVCFCDLVEIVYKGNAETAMNQAGERENVLGTALRQWYPPLLLLWEDTMQTFFESMLHGLHSKLFGCNALQPFRLQGHVPRVLFCLCVAACEDPKSVPFIQDGRLIGLCFQAIPLLVTEEAWQSVNLLLSALSHICDQLFSSDAPVADVAMDLLDLLMWLATLEDCASVSHVALSQLLLKLCKSPVQLTGQNFDKASSLACALFQVMLLQPRSGNPSPTSIATLLECFHSLSLQEGGNMLNDSLFLYSVGYIFDESTGTGTCKHLSDAMKELVCCYPSDLKRHTLELTLGLTIERIDGLHNNDTQLQRILELVLYCGSCCEKLGYDGLGHVCFSTKAAFEVNPLACTLALLEFLKRTTSSHKVWCVSNLTMQHLAFVVEEVYSALNGLARRNTGEDDVQVVLEGMKCVALYRTVTSGTALDEKFVTIFLHLLVEVLKLPEASNQRSLKLASTSLLRRVLVAGDPVIRNTVLELPPESKTLLQDILHGSTKEIHTKRDNHVETKPKIQLKTSFTLGSS